MTKSPTAAMIFCAGFGTRMGALTKHIPKPMVPLQGRPMVDHAIDLLHDAGIGRLVANIHYLSQEIEPHLASKGVVVSPETPEILDTGGGLKFALPLLRSEPVITLNPDAAWTGPNPVSRLVDAWHPDMQALLLLVPLSKATTRRDTGDFSLKKGEIERNGDYLYTGLQIVRTDRLVDIDDQVFSLNKYWDHLASNGPLHGTVYEGRWCDIGNPEGLAAAEEMLSRV